jgi:Fe2+ transport system protein B
MMTRNNGERAVSDALLFLAILLVNEMLIRVSNNFFFTRVMFAEDFVNDGNKELNTIIHHRPKCVIIWGRNSVLIFVPTIMCIMIIRTNHHPFEIIDLIIPYSKNSKSY